MIHETIAKLEAETFSVKMLYVTKSGSKLFGTSTPASDTDYEGIYLPNKPSHFFGRHAKMPTVIDLGDGDFNESNTADNTDCNFVSVSSWFHELSKGIPQAIDTLFSMWSDQIVLQDDHFVNWCKANYESLIRLNHKAFVGFAAGQAKRYGVKGERYKELVHFGNEVANTMLPTDKIGNCSAHIAFMIEAFRFSHIKFTDAPAPRGQDGSWAYLQVLDKLYAPTVKVSYLLEKLNDMEASYGDRVKGPDDGVDWKALYAGLRAVNEGIELLETGKVVFPLASAEELLQVKQGKVPLNEVTVLLEERIATLDKLAEEKGPQPASDVELYEDFVASMYT